MVRKLRDRDTFPGAPLPVEDTGPDPEPAPARPDGYRYERPHIADSAVHRLLDGLKAPRFPRSTTLSETDGQLAAHYDVGPRSVPARVPTSTPQPSVLVSTTTANAEPPQLLGAAETATVDHTRSWFLVVIAAIPLMTIVAIVAIAFSLPKGRARTEPVAAMPLPASVEVAVAPLVPVVVSTDSVSTTTPRVPVPQASTAPPHRNGVTPGWRKPADPVVLHSKEPDVPRSNKMDREEE